MSKGTAIKNLIYSCFWEKIFRGELSSLLLLFSTMQCEWYFGSFTWNFMKMHSTKQVLICFRKFDVVDYRHSMTSHSTLSSKIILLTISAKAPYDVLNFGRDVQSKFQFPETCKGMVLPSSPLKFCTQCLY